VEQGPPDRPVRALAISGDSLMHQFCQRMEKKLLRQKVTSPVYRLNQGDGTVFGANVLILIYGDAFLADLYNRRQLEPGSRTDSMKKLHPAREL